MSSEYYGMDTKIEEEFEADLPANFDFLNEIITDEKELQKQHYLEECYKQNLSPQTRVLESLQLDHLNLGHRALGTAGIRAICSTLMENRTIIRLTLTDNGFNEDCGPAIARLIANNPNIKHLSLALNPLTAVGLAPICASVRIYCAMKQLDLRACRLAARGARIVAQLMQHCDVLEDLNLSDNQINDEGVRAIAAGLYGSKLKDLNLRHNHIRPFGAVVLFKALQRNTHLEKLDIGLNGLHYEGSLGIGELLSNNDKLRFLDVAFCRIMWDGAVLVAKGLRDNTTLEVLRIGNNPITTTGCMDLIEAISGRRNVVKELDLLNSPVTAEFEFVSQAISKKRPFCVHHGGIVNAHDVLGQRKDKKLSPMQKVINYMHEREIRPTELFRTFDKNQGNKINYNDFVEKLSKAGIDLTEDEAQELMEMIDTNRQSDMDKGKPAEEFNYQVLVKTVTKQINRDRHIRFQEMENLRREKEKHKEIFEKSHTNLHSSFDDLSLSSLPRQQTMLNQTPRSITNLSLQSSLTSLQSLKRSNTNLISLTTALGAKAETFGTSQKLLERKKKPKTKKNKDKNKTTKKKR